MATWWVSTTGSDSNPGTQALPFATWAHADSVATAGDTIMVQPDGTYTFASTQVTSTNGNIAFRVNFISAKLPQKVVVVGTMLTAQLWQTKGNYVTITGFDLSGTAVNSAIEVWGDHTQVLHNYVHDVGIALDPSVSGEGISTLATQSTLGTNEIAYNLVLRCGYQGSGGTQQFHGIYPTSQFEFIHHNIVGDSGGWGIHLLGPHTGTTVVPNHEVVANNLLFQNTWGGIQVKSTSGTAADFIYCINNIIAYNGRRGVTGSAIIEQGTTGTNNVYDHNLTYGNLGASATNGYSLQNGLVATNQITTAPGFYGYAADGSGNYHQLLISPGINAGTRTLPAWIDPSFGWTTDFDGTTLPSSGALDLGPYQTPFAPPRTTLHVCTYTATTDTATITYDLNDFANTWLHTDTLKLQPGKKKAVRSGNIRTDGERVVRWARPNAHLTCEVYIRDVSPQAALTRAHSLIRAIDQTPYVVRMALPGATSYVYFDVQLCDHTEPTDPKLIQAGAITHISIDFECEPTYRGDRITLSNLACNPGFETPFGGAQVSTVTVAFSDSFTNGDAYDPQTYTDAITSTGPIRWYRMDGSTGNVAFDYGSQATNATYTGGFTLAQQPGQQGGSDLAVLFDGTSGYVSVPTTGLPTGNSNLALECWFKVSAYPASGARLMHIGNFPTNSQFLAITINASGQVSVSTGTATTSLSSAVALNVWHHAVATYDGAKIHNFVDGAEVGTGAAFTTMNLVYGNCTIASIGGTVSFFPGLMDDCAIYNVALSAATVSSHYTNGTPVAVSVASNQLTIPSGARVALGSTAWSALQTWQIRFQFATGLTANFFLHYTDVNNRIYVQVAAGVLAIIHTVGGTAHTLTTVAPTYTNGTFYWLQITQFPTASGDPPYVQATLLSDSAGSIGSQINQVGAAAFDSITALKGRPEIGASGASLVIGGNFSGVHAVRLFGPGGWFVAQGTSSTAVASGGWDTDWGSSIYTLSNPPTVGLVNSANGGYVQVPVTSLAAARLDLPAAGVPDVYWANYNGGAPTGTAAIPVAVAGDTLGLTAAVNSVKLSSSATITFNVNEYDASGNLLRAGNAGTLTGNQASWTTMYGTYTTGASCAYVGVRLRVQDLTAASPSANIWFDNVQVWNVTRTGQSSMPYCELRSQNSPTRVLVSGIKGDAMARAFVAVGTYANGWNNNTFLTVLGRKRTPVSGAARFVMPDIWNQALTSVAMALDTTSYAGYYFPTLGGYEDNPIFGHPGDLAGVYHLWSRYFSGQSTGNVGNVTTQVGAFDQTTANMFTIFPSQTIWIYRGPTVAPLAAGSTWTPADAGQVTIPLTPRGALTDLSQPYTMLGAIWSDFSPPANNRINWHALIPVDAEVAIVKAINPSASGVTATGWFWEYLDGLPVLSTATTGPQGVASYSVETTPLPNPGAARGGPGTTSSPSININLAADPYLRLDPTTTLNGTPVNQFVGFISNNAGDVLPMYTEIQYAPAYLFPR